MRFLPGVLGALAMCGAILPGAASAQPVNTGHLTAELVSAVQGVAPGQTIQVALRQDIQKDWHTYWRNAGDSGEATQIAWTLPTGWSASGFTWPTPHRIPFGPLVNYGYEGEVLLPMTVTAPAGATPGGTVTLRAKATFLVCADICIPEEATLALALPVTAQPAPADPRWGARIERAVAEAPKPAGLVAAFERSGEVLKLAVTGAPLKGRDLAGAYFFPFSGTVIDHAKPQAIERGPEGLTLSIAPGYDFQSPTPPTEVAGVLALDGAAYEVTAVAGPPPAGAAGLGPPPARAGPGGGVSLGLISAAVFAFAGGLILNLMPCVFPVLAMKAASLAGHGGAGGDARRQGLAFGAGVVASFLALAGGLIALRAAGLEAGWGFQLQDPTVVAVLALIMLAVALNLSGVFEIGASFQGVGSGLAARGGLSGAFFTGVLAVVVAAPCTAPFMGPAMGWAMVQPPVAALTVFLALALGFALPFVALAFIPGLVERLPRPGPWMDVFRKALAFPMYAAVVWLVWVLTVQVGPDAVPRILGAGVVLALAGWLYGAAQRRAIVGGRTLGLSGAAVALAVAAVAGGAVWPTYAVATDGISGSAELDDEAYTPERLAALRAEGRPVLVNYTAAWCVSCQVNDRVALSTRGVAEALDRNNAVYLKADWTRRDAGIAAELASFGRAGVPLYLVYGADGGDPAILPAILTEGLVVKALDAAGKPS
ncbi:protein-disulfide reductase DsbD domain-containing protein [Phenylobacterium sp. SCN 70-31]|uniref:protein-disulfide reductase DsbD family protein n=1 Tax=Phenylobacterium sp. SCN 70-31 TaxID=1660129 RepID=UPI0008696987|nr:protein-disulfide reductase DsbD domain-containing protein [Phenylobacterium sp. SCN 70-31]ODT85480.1 MAG: thiol:disulfide interchange protein [Phenylobacterium sp. SCN 70-31]